MTEVPLPTVDTTQRDVNIAGQSLPSLEVQEASPLATKARANEPEPLADTVTVDSQMSLPAQSVPDGGSLLILADDGNDAAIKIDGSFPLIAGDSLPLPVSDASNVEVSPAAGTQTLHYITTGTL